VKRIEFYVKPIRMMEATRSNLSIWPFLLFVACYVAAFAILLRDGYAVDAFRTLRYVAMFAILVTCTCVFEKSERDVPKPGRRLWLQFVVCVGAIVATGAVSAWFGSEDDAPFAALVGLYGSGFWQFAIEVCAVYFALRALGLSGFDLGLRRTLRGAAPVWFLWIATASGFFTIDVLNGAVGAGPALTDIAQNIFRNGFSEEFLFRGVLLSRLRLVVANEWALLIQALVFGAWHYGADIRVAHGNLLVAVCFMITVQGVFGYALGFLALRTRSIAIGSAFHAIADATSIV
jgi:membrane protease YdiL (CAAX protease family)